MFKKLAVWLIIHTVDRPVDRFSKSFNRWQAPVDRPVDRPKQRVGCNQSVDRLVARHGVRSTAGRPDNVHTCTHPTVKTTVDRSVDHSDL